MTPICLNEFAKTEFSQSGEDGILEALFSEVGISTGFFVEFGAWDGQHLSNTYRLIRQGWGGLLIEGNQNRFLDLQRNIRNESISKVCKYVAISGDDSLDSILGRVDEVPTDFDLLSIDIDSDDLAIWESLSDYRPKCVVIEYNPTIPEDVVFRNRPGCNHGNSARAIDDFAESANYVLVAWTDTNLIYLAREVWERTRIKRLTISDIVGSVRFFFGYDGTLFVNRGDECSSPEVISVPWTNMSFPQPVPKLLRRFDDYQLLKTVLGGCSVVINRPLLLPEVAAKAWKRFLR